MKLFSSSEIRSTQSYQQIVRIDGGASGNRNGLYCAVHWSGHLDLHLHGLQHNEHITGLHRLADLTFHLEDAAGHGAVHRSFTSAHRNRGGCGGRLSSGGGGRAQRGGRGRVGGPEQAPPEQQPGQEPEPPLQQERQQPEPQGHPP